jgi:hypothetical protein
MEAKNDGVHMESKETNTAINLPAFREQAAYKEYEREQAAFKEYEQEEAAYGHGMQEECQHGPRIKWLNTMITGMGHEQ